MQKKQNNSFVALPTFANAALAAIAILSIPSLSLATTATLLWTGATTSNGSATLNGNSAALSPSASAPLTLDIQIDADSRGVAVASLNIAWDTDLGNEVNLITFEELSWSNLSGNRVLDPIAPGVASSLESTDLASGFLYQLDGTTVGNGPKNTALTLGVGLGVLANADRRLT
jgi:hypothetical protein